MTADTTNIDSVEQDVRKPHYIGMIAMTDICNNIPTLFVAETFRGIVTVIILKKIIKKKVG